MAETASQNVVVETKDLGRNFQTNWAVRGIQLVLRHGEKVALLGANGAGKSTLLRLLAGWYPPATGELRIAGHRMRTQDAAIRRQIMLLDDPVAYEGNVVDVITQAITDYKVDRPKIENEVADWFHKLGLVGVYSKSARSVSKGQRFKIAMICLFVVRPQIWLLDEPFSAGLDAGGLNILESQMKQHAEQGGLVVFSSQWPQHANRLADRAIVLHEGQIVHELGTDQRVDPQWIETAEPALASVLTGLGRV